MLRKELDIRQRSLPIPIALLISTANAFVCDIFVEYGQSRVNVKNYDEMKRDFDTHTPSITFSFNGQDEDLAQQRIACLFAP